MPASPSRRTVPKLGAWLVLVVVLSLVACDLRVLDRFTILPDIERVWTTAPPFSSAGFWTYRHLVLAGDANDRLRALLEGALRNRFDGRAVSRYQAIELASLLEALGEAAGRGSWLTITNIRGEKLYLTMSDVARERPVIVVGLDDQPELYHLYWAYRSRRAYTWQYPDSTRQWLVRPLGPFLFYRSPPASHLGSRTFAEVGLLPTSFARTDQDPLAAARDVGPEVGRVLFGTADGCLSCHAFRGEGGRAHRLDALTGRPRGGVALELGQYPRSVMERFLFDQVKVADELGMTPLRLERQVAEALLLLTHGPARGDSVVGRFPAPAPGLSR